MSRARAMSNQSDQSGSALLEREWTLMVYMVSDGPVAPNGGAPGGGEEMDLDQILSIERNALARAVEALGDAGQVHVAVQIDYLKYPGVFRWSDGAGEVTRVKEESSAADPEVLQRFYKWGLTFPARRYALMFWGHSSGPSGLFTDAMSTFGPVGRSGIDTLNLPRLGHSIAKLSAALGKRPAQQAQNTPEPLQVVIFKDCFQSLLETAFELGHGEEGPRVRYMIASQGLIPVAMEADDENPPKPLPSWPYVEMLACFDDAETERVVTRLVESLGEYYRQRKNRGHHIDVPIAALKLDEVENVAKPLKALGEQIQRAMDNPHTVDQIEDAFRRAFRGVVDGDPMLVDVSSLCDRLSELNIASLTTAADELRACLATLVFVRRPAKRTAFNGVSVYYYPLLPQERVGTSIGLVNGSHYERLQLNKRTEWHTVALAGTPSALARARYL
jgi:hypothetical protein